MVNQGPWQDVDRSTWRGRLRDARNFLSAAQDSLALSDPQDSGKPIMSNALLSVIAYGDALTIKFAGIKNAKDHRGLSKALKHALGNRAEKKQIRRVRRLIGQKNDIDYHHRDLDLAEARKFLKRAERFTGWAEQELAR